MRRASTYLQPQTKSGNGTSFWRFLFKAVVSAILLWLPLRHTPLNAVGAQIATVERSALWIAFLILSIHTFVAAVRWTIILRILGMPRGLGVTYPASLIGLFFGQALPGGVGSDAVRIWQGCKSGLPAQVSISSILADRLTGFLAILLIVTVELSQLHFVVRDPALFYPIIVLLAASYAGLAVVMALDRLPPGLHRFRVVRGLVRVSADLRAAVFSRAGLPVILCGVVIQMSNVFAVFALAQGLHLPGALAASMLVVPLANVLQSLPISIAGWGVRESFFVVMFGMVGVAAAPAIAISVVFGLLTIASSLPGGVLWLLQGTGSPARAREVGRVGTAASGE
jgi:uncharacterized membrane protein YbhN (UPF0104 family)